jgi:hypothetical protein
MTVEQAIRQLMDAAGREGVDIVVRVYTSQRKQQEPSAPRVGNLEKVMRIISEAGQLGVSTTSLVRRVPKIMAPERNAILSELLKKGWICKDVVNGKTKSTIIWRSRPMP